MLRLYELRFSVETKKHEMGKWFDDEKIKETYVKYLGRSIEIVKQLVGLF
jgi:hypothetical protein